LKNAFETLSPSHSDAPRVLHSRWIRAYFLAVGSFAFWVGLWGYLVPGEIARAIPWEVPPLHARFIGSMYLSGLVLMAAGFVTLHRCNIRIALWMAAIWTGMLLVVSLLHLPEFDFTLTPVWFWFAAYIVYPVAGALLALIYCPEIHSKAALAPSWAIAFLALQGTVSVLLALALFFAPTWMTGLWPWKISVLLAQIYSGPFLSYGFGSLYLALHPRLNDWGIAILSLFTFSLLVLVASVMHRAVFGPIGVSAALWFGGFAIVTIGLAVIGTKSLRVIPPE
jgi:hypothetical protein